jgi:FkbM family methyltransferase
MGLVMLLSRFIELLNGFVRYGNPVHIILKRAFAKTGLLTISDRRTGVSVTAAVKSSHMFGETWYSRDYDVPGCPLRPGDSVLDIGANQGFFTCYAASKGAIVRAFEPSPDSFERLQTNVERNRFSSAVTISQQAVSSATGITSLWCSDYLGGGANTIVASHLKSIPDTIRTRIEVDTVNINSILSEFTHGVRLCKMDCEGAEFEILGSLSDPSKIDSFAIEYHPGAYPLRDLAAIMVNWGTHQISFAKTSHMLYAVRTSILFEYADSQV